ncbi:FUSC family protein [Winogradskya consettensis]|uniref:FUSC family protein n=1 Tax=Winogradskya consettensis TaxID=113560 RepID=A0A919VW10_9ACTN|nr:FUSC family protein [Actinoplanes consettensis]GIM77200.1 FUSC family protein [Actinoplanes consettensis]
MTSPLSWPPFAWLARHDPQLAAVRRAARVTLVACLGFYFCRYALSSPAMAPYALFGTIALGMLSQIPGNARQRARTLLAVLPVTWVLITLGTLLSVSNWAAAAGMFVLGFAVTFAGVGGPRLVGLATGMQLLYILPCFPPYDPGVLPERLAGVSLAVVLLAVAEVVLWPGPQPVPYRERLADAVDALAGCLAVIADHWDGDPRGKERLAALLPDATEAGDALRPSRLPVTQRPASAGRRDRALSSASATTRLVLGRAVDLYFTDDTDAVSLPAAARLLRETASCASAAGAWLRGQGEVPDTDRIAGALAHFRAEREAEDPSGVAPERLRLGSLALSLGEWTKSLVTELRIVARAPLRADVQGPYWYASRPAPSLWWHRLRENLTPRSVYFQGALRLAAALAVARLLAGELDLSHGFWVLLTILTVLRTSAAETRSALRPALTGTVIGSLAAAVLLVYGTDPTLYAIALPLVMFVGNAAGPLLGQGWAQALFTLVITLVFAQLAPTDWHLAEARVLDVAVGALVGVLIGLFAWPRGGSGELHRATANFLAASSAVVHETVATLSSMTPPGPALPLAREQERLAEASYALYQSERHAPATLDWQATLIAGKHAVRGAEALLRDCPTGRLLPCAALLTLATADVAGRFEATAEAIRSHRLPQVQDDPAPDLGWPTDLGRDLYHLADLRVWLDGLRDDLTRVTGRPERQGPVPVPLA